MSDHRLLYDIVGPGYCPKCMSTRNADYTCPLCDKTYRKELGLTKEVERAAEDFGRQAAIEIVEKHWPILRDALDKLISKSK